MTITVYDDNGDEVSVRTHKEVCPRCHGEGTHVNPAVDGNGISSEQFHDDPDFADAYFSGVYDVSCEECKGNNVIDVPDEDDPNFHLWVQEQRDRAEDAAIRRAEMGYRY